jgi:hypothetical protein
MNLYLKRLPRSIGSAKPLLYSGLSEQVNTRQETPNEEGIRPSGARQGVRRASVGSADSKEAEHWQFLGGSRDGVRVLASGSGQAPEADRFRLPA